MKNIYKLLLLVGISFFMSCDKETLPVVEEENALRASFTSKTKKLKAHQVKKEPPFAARSGHTSLKFKKRMWVIAGFGGEHKNDVWSSPNGVHWGTATQDAAFPARQMHASTVFRGRMWVAGGDDVATTGLFDQMNDVWYSKNGKNWWQATASAAFSSRYDHTLTTFKGAMWLIGGRSYDGVTGTADHADVWKSTNGKDWILIEDDAPFGGRGGHTAVVHNKKLWIIGGSSIDGWKNDVWYSSDGLSWTEATDDADFSPRSNHQTVSDGKRMWLSSGRFGANYYDDIWCSFNGSTWTEVETSQAFPGRDGHTSLQFNKRLWIINGKDGSSLGDIWYFK